MKLRGAAVGRRAGVVETTFFAGVLAIALSASNLAFAQASVDEPGPSLYVEGHGVTIESPSQGALQIDEAEQTESEVTSSRWFFQRFETKLQKSGQERDALLEQAEAELKAGRRDAAQRLLERLIAESPDSDEAKKARAHLAALYRGEPYQAAVRTGASAELPWAQGARVTSSTELRRPPVRVARAVEDKFVADVGDRVFFSQGSVELGMRARGVLRAQARFLLKRPELGVLIEGHADDGSIATAEAEKLSAARAEAVRERLLAEGVDPSRIAIAAKGRTDRVAACSGAECQAQNRRAVTVLFNGFPIQEPAMASAGPSPTRQDAQSPATQ